MPKCASNSQHNLNQITSEQFEDLPLYLLSDIRVKSSYNQDLPASWILLHDCTLECMPPVLCSIPQELPREIVARSFENTGLNPFLFESYCMSILLVLEFWLIVSK